MIDSKEKDMSMKKKLFPSPRAWKEAKAAYLFVAPTLIGLLILNFYPIISTFYLSFCKTGDFGLNNTFAGLVNYARLIRDPDIPQSLLNTFRYALVQVSFSISLSLVLAVLVNRKMRAVSVYRTIYFLPMICAPAAIAMVWRWMFNSDFGLLNKLLGTHISWTTNPNTAWLCVAVVGVWSSLGYNMVLLRGGLQDIPKDYYEAAAIDGASGIDAFFHVTIPLLSPTLFFIIQTGIIGALQLFDLPYMIIDESSRAMGTVKSVTYLFYQHSFMKGERGYGSAIVIFMMLVIALITWLIQRTEKRWVHYN